MAQMVNGGKNVKTIKAYATITLCLSSRSATQVWGREAHKETEESQIALGTALISRNGSCRRTRQLAAAMAAVAT